MTGKGTKLSLKASSKQKDFKKYWAVLEGAQLCVYDRADKMLASMDSCLPLLSVPVDSCLAALDRSAGSSGSSSARLASLCQFTVCPGDGSIVTVRAETQRECEVRKEM